MAIKTSTQLKTFFIFLLILSYSNSRNTAQAQCTFGGTQYPGTSVAVPATNGTTATVSTCNYFGEYSVLTGFTVGNQYTLTAPGGYVTVFDASNVAVAWGNSPLNFIPPSTATYKARWTAIGCGTDATCHTTTVTLVGPTTPMVYNSSTVTQSSTSSTVNCASDVQVIRLEVSVSGGTSPLSLTNIQTNFTGTAPIAGIPASRIYYTGTSGTFATSSVFGSATASTSAYNISGAQTLATGTNYFWLVYDLSTSATAGTTIDAAITQFTLSAANYTPSTTAPAGSRTTTACYAPGGVNSGLETWLRADIGTSGTASMTGWSNQVSTGTATNLNGNPSLNQTNTSYNYNYYVDFAAPAATLDGGVAASRQCILLNGYTGISGIDYKTLFFTFQLNDLTRLNTHTATVKGVTMSTPTNGTWHGDANGASASILLEAYDISDFGTGSPAGTWQRNQANILSNSNHVNTKHILSALCQTGGNTTLNAFLGGQDDQTPSSGFAGHVRDWKGPAAEIIGFRNALTVTERRKVDSYLAIKYGITLPNNYLSTNGTNIFTVASPYNNNIIGIGRDDAELLNQKQSHYDDDNARIYLGALAAMNPANGSSFSTDGSYVVMGDNSGAYCATAASISEMPLGLTNCLLYSRLEREWKVTRTNMAQNYNMDVKLATCGAPGSVDITHLRLLVDDDGNFANGGTQCYYNGDGTGITFSYSSPTITVSNISVTHIPNNATRFITIASINPITPLPLTLLDFQATLNKNHRYVDLVWYTESENNSDYFEVQKLEGKDWKTIDYVQAQGESTLITRYASIDPSPVVGVNYYRLKQFDLNGSYTYSDIRVVNLDLGSEIYLFPNPATFNAQLIQKRIANKTITILDNAGRKVSPEIHVISDDSLEIRTDNLANGVYLICIEDHPEILRLVVNH
ncbi:MAG: hypothetical protein K0S23_192 [Fluviicola sp.]|jgi:hypothetical protein|uniref:BNR-repeat neuraminidase N-terminal domain-containing protein n=1 Tax=Fluviicola sp. TaxID=1917219 RepID=UPI00262B500C|nr:BNR-repeat neuraminidase N-terminal domain-containing protein [Fluviicola sp.]MDF3025885.1 hypothetical protein [Fluviicola sp.]